MSVTWSAARARTPRARHSRRARGGRGDAQGLLRRHQFEAARQILHALLRARREVLERNVRLSALREDLVGDLHCGRRGGRDGGLMEGARGGRGARAGRRAQEGTRVGETELREVRARRRRHCLRHWHRASRREPPTRARSCARRTDVAESAWSPRGVREGGGNFAPTRRRPRDPVAPHPDRRYRAN